MSDIWGRNRMIEECVFRPPMQTPMQRRWPLMLKNKSKLLKTAYLILFLFFIINFANISASPALALEKASNGKLLSFEGEVQLIRSGGEKPFKAFNNMRIAEGDQLITGSKGWAKILLDDDITAIVSENSRVYLSELRSQGQISQTSINLQSGGLASSVEKKIAGSSRYQIETPTAAMGVRGTDFFTLFYRGRLDVRVVHGFLALDVNLAANNEVASTGPAKTFSTLLTQQRQFQVQTGERSSKLFDREEELTIVGLPGPFLQRLLEIDQERPGLTPVNQLGQINTAMEEAQRNLLSRENESKKSGIISEYDRDFELDLDDPDADRDIKGDPFPTLPAFAPAEIEREPIALPDWVTMDPRWYYGYSDSGSSGGDSDDSSSSSDSGDPGPGQEPTIFVASYFDIDHHEHVNPQTINWDLNQAGGFFSIYLYSALDPDAENIIYQIDVNNISGNQVAELDSLETNIFFINVLDRGQARITITASLDGQTESFGVELNVY